jgi:hypothetical protein
VLENWIGKRQSDAQRKEFKRNKFLVRFLVSLKNLREKARDQTGKKRKK